MDWIIPLAVFALVAIWLFKFGQIVFLHIRLLREGSQSASQMAAPYMILGGTILGLLLLLAFDLEEYVAQHRLIERLVVMICFGGIGAGWLYGAITVVVNRYPMYFFGIGWFTREDHPVLYWMCLFIPTLFAAGCLSVAAATAAGLLW